MIGTELSNYRSYLKGDIERQMTDKYAELYYRKYQIINRKTKHRSINSINREVNSINKQLLTIRKFVTLFLNREITIDLGVVAYGRLSIMDLHALVKSKDTEILNRSEDIKTLINYNKAIASSL